MMGSCSEEEEDRFFDSREDLTSSDSGSNCQENFDSNPGFLGLASGSFLYHVWIQNPGSIHERRKKFLKWMGLSSDRTVMEDCGHPSTSNIEVEMDRITENSGAVLRYSGFEDRFSSSRSSISCWSNEASELSEDGVSEANLICRIKNLDAGTEFIVDELGRDGMLSRLNEMGSNQVVAVKEFQRDLGLSPLAQHFMRKEVAGATNSAHMIKRAKNGWLRRLGAVACIFDKEKGCNLEPRDPDLSFGARVQRVRVRPYRKRSKEFSALYMGQEIPAHDGSILTMKFSLDGWFLATAGEDGVVRVWQVMEYERTNEDDIADIDPSYVYYKVNSSSELAPLFPDKERLAKLKSIGRMSESVCVVLPRRIFRLSEKPLHEFHGHSGEVLDLSWSSNKHLLSSSVDKTVRLWQMGCHHCLKVFSHNNYVTCVQFNPVNDKYFISGSIDGKVRIWEIPHCQVVDWTDVREIVTAVCYQPDGQGGIVGSMTGNCRFYDASDNHLQLVKQICLQGKKKSPGKRITGFQFSPSDPTKLMVTSADSQVRILDGFDVIFKYRGLRNAGSQISASFTSDGKHIVSASEDSNIYIWDYISEDGPAPSQAKSIWSCERFISDNASVAIPWCGVMSTTMETQSTFQIPEKSAISSQGNKWQHYPLDWNSHNVLPLSSPDHFSPSHGLFSEALPKGSATWPEEKLPTLGSLTVSSTMCKSQYKFLKASCQGALSSHAWGLVIVTAGWDGRIRSFHNYGLPIRL
ncbi:PREDICTED: 2-deoxy-glucose resistant protein 2 [Nelumbo nucifera]|uniref:2-deoxy-glucose resistant protein 2 n=1 Tax=Nelumbo nucifera TaxID=4432 RepID=A0A1U8AN35_NELNU|nr:PREDICTED: 2-deoxy-glucose resistant protein 2 [Nelumbo nucifera]XP_010267521.1 PREDICTED: 2-deoxy-glucose resistant protein 2 [Nelumbo nucifera]